MTTTTTDDLNLREGAGTNYEIIKVLPKGSGVTIIDGPWYLVTASGEKGWVSGKYLDLDGVPAAVLTAAQRTFPRSGSGLIGLFRYRITFE